MVKLISVALVCVGVVVPAMAKEQPHQRPLRYAVYVTQRAVPVPCTTDTDCERRHGGPVVLNSRPVRRT